MSYHASNFGAFAGHVLPFADLNGYVPEVGDTADEFKWGGLTEWDEDSWAEHVAGAAKATADARTAVDLWRQGVPFADSSHAGNGPGM